MQPTMNPPQRRLRGPGRRRRLGVLAVLAFLFTALTPTAAYADPCWTCWPPPPTVPCASLGPIIWHEDRTNGLYAKNGIQFDVLSTTQVFDVAYGRINRNDTDIVVTGNWAASVSRTITMTSTFNFGVSVASEEELRVTVTAETGFQLTQSVTTQVGVGGSTDIPPFTTILGEYGLVSLDVVFNARPVFMRHDQVWCVLAREPYVNQTAHIPTLIEGWRYTRI